MKRVCGVLLALSLVLGAKAAEADYSIFGEFSGGVDFFSGAPDFFRSTDVAAVDKVTGSITLNRAVVNGIDGYAGTADYLLSFYGPNNQLIQSFTGSGSSAYFTVPAGMPGSAGFGISDVTGGAWGDKVVLSSFSASSDTALDGRFIVAFQTAGSRKPGTIEGVLNGPSVITFTEQPLPTPVPATLPLLASGLVGFGCLRRRVKIK